MVDGWRREVLRAVIKRPDAEKFWGAVQEEWRYYFAEYESQKPGAEERVAQRIDATIQQRDALSTDEKKQRAREFIQGQRKELKLPDLKTMKSIYQIL